jgi:steroid delta-isomerase-like uncharacterized protein
MMGHAMQGSVPMPAPTPAEVIRDWFETVWSKGRDDLIGVYCSAETVLHGLDETGAACKGAEGFRPFYDRLRAAMPDVSFTVHEVIESGPMVACRWTATATHTGDHLGPPASHQPVTISGMSMGRVENGRILEGWNEWDRLAMALAIGAVAPCPPPGR